MFAVPVAPPNQRLHLARAAVVAVALDCVWSSSAVEPLPQSGVVVAAQLKR
jgi:hypothetical protein